MESKVNGAFFLIGFYEGFNIFFTLSFLYLYSRFHKFYKKTSDPRVRDLAPHSVFGLRSRDYYLTLNFIKNLSFGRVKLLLFYKKPSYFKYLFILCSYLYSFLHIIFNVFKPLIYYFVHTSRTLFILVIFLVLQEYF